MESGLTPVRKSDLPKNKHDRTCTLCRLPYGKVYSIEHKELDLLRAFRELPEHDTVLSNNPVRLPCGHIFGKSCIQQAFEKLNRCPLCQTVLFRARPMLAILNRLEAGGVDLSCVRAFKPTIRNLLRYEVPKRGTLRVEPLVMAKMLDFNIYALAHQMQKRRGARPQKPGQAPMADVMDKGFREALNRSIIDGLFNYTYQRVAVSTLRCGLLTHVGQAFRRARCLGTIWDLEDPHYRFRETWWVAVLVVKLVTAEAFLRQKAAAVRESGSETVTWSAEFAEIGAE